MSDGFPSRITECQLNRTLFWRGVFCHCRYHARVRVSSKRVIRYSRLLRRSGIVNPPAIKRTLTAVGPSPLPLFRSTVQPTGSKRVHITSLRKPNVVRKTGDRSSPRDRIASRTESRTNHGQGASWCGQFTVWGTGQLLVRRRNSLVSPRRGCHPDGLPSYNLLNSCSRRINSSTPDSRIAFPIPVGR